MLRLSVIAAIVACLTAGSALAASPPKGSYGCAIGSGGEYAGQLIILDGSHYRINKGKIATFVASGKKLTFPSGPFHGYFRGRWYINSAHRAQIGLTSLGSGIETEYCEFGT